MDVDFDTLIEQLLLQNLVTNSIDLLAYNELATR
jgi:hypothetical protein